MQDNLDAYFSHLRGLWLMSRTRADKAEAFCNAENIFDFLNFGSFYRRVQHSWEDLSFLSYRSLREKC